MNYLCCFPNSFSLKAYPDYGRQPSGRTYSM